MDWENKIKKLRNKLCITQVELAEMLGIAFISVNRYENGKSTPTMKVRRQLNKLFLENGIGDE